MTPLNIFGFGKIVIGIALFAGLVACGDGETPPPPQTPQTPDTDLGDNSGTPLPFAHTKTLKCILKSQDGKLQTSSSYLKYNPNTNDPITADMLEIPDPNRQKRLNESLARTKITDARVELPLGGGNQVFTLIGAPYLNGSMSMTFHEPRGGTKSKTTDGFWFGKPVKGNLWEGVLSFSNGNTNWVEGSWHFQAGGNPENLQFGSLRCDIVDE